MHGNALAGSAMQPAVTWIGHATTLVQAGGLNMLTDPMFSRARLAARLHRPEAPRRARASRWRELPHIDAVVISHNHYDHLDDASVRALAGSAAARRSSSCRSALKAWLAERGIDRAVELDWWQAPASARSRSC